MAKEEWTSKVRKKAEIRTRYNQVPHLTQDTTWESNKNTKKKHHQQEQRGQPFPASDHKAAMNRRKSMRNIRHKKHIKEVPSWNGQYILLEGLNRFQGANPTLSPDVDQDT